MRKKYGEDDPEVVVHKEGKTLRQQFFIINVFGSAKVKNQRSAFNWKHSGSSIIQPGKFTKSIIINNIPAKPKPCCDVKAVAAVA